MRKFGNHQVVLTGLLLGLLLLSVSTAFAADGNPPIGDFQQTEYSIFGNSNSSTWNSVLSSQSASYDQVGGDGKSAPDEFSNSAKVEVSDEEDEQIGPANMGRKVKTGILSALLPGAGQYYNGYKKKAYIMAGVEVGIWTAFFIFDHQGDLRMESSREYAGLFAGTSGSHDNSYWQSVGRHMDSDSFNESRLREARALQEPVSGLVAGADAWQWVNEDRKSGYLLQRADGNRAYEHRDFMILFSVINRAFSVIDGVMGVKSHPGGIEADVLGMNVSLDMLPSWDDPGAKWAISRSF